MATKKKSANSTAATAAPDPALTAAYEEALLEYASAVDLLRKGNFAEAKVAFGQVAEANPDEGTLVDRCRTYTKICDQKLNDAPFQPGDAEECYQHAVMLANNGQWDEAIGLLDRALKDAPASPKFLYARASAHALRGNADPAIADLRQAISAEPQIRFQAVNDPDFEKVREEPAFIDIIEPTPSGV
jgi:tetratricopeptide (TPR) repeat protein